MIEEGNPPNTHTEVANVGVGSSSQAVVKVYATTAEAIANFKPTHREVISGIAPHVFDERKRRRNQRRASSPSRPYEPVAEKRSSPLRATSVCAWEVEHSIYLSEQSATSKHSYLIPCLKFNEYSSRLGRGWPSTSRNGPQQYHYQCYHRKNKLGQLKKRGTLEVSPLRCPYFQIEVSSKLLNLSEPFCDGR